MKANELMIGDWVQISEPCKYHGAIGCIKTLIDHKDDETAYFKIFLRSNTIHIGIEDICSDDIKPIPLTQEILEKNGWIKNLYSVESYDNEEFERLSLWVGEDCKNKWWWHVGVELVTPINYVHELQHALRLCGIEKEIIL